MSFNRTHRLTSKADFQSVFASASKISRKTFIVLFKPNGLTHARLGIIIGKQYVALAVDRNRIRRLIRESFRHHQQEINGYDIVMIVKRNLDLKQEIDQVWTQIKVKKS